MKSREPARVSVRARALRGLGPSWARQPPRARRPHIRAGRARACVDHRPGARAAASEPGGATRPRALLGLGVGVGVSRLAGGPARAPRRINELGARCISDAVCARRSPRGSRPSARTSGKGAIEMRVAMRTLGRSDSNSVLPPVRARGAHDEAETGPVRSLAG